MNPTRLSIVFACLILLLQAGDSFGATGTRLDKKSSNPTELANRRYQKGLKQADQADELLQQALMSDNKKNQDKLKKKALAKYGKAISLYQRALAVRPSMPDAQHNLIVAMIRSHQYAEAIAMLESSNARKTDKLAYEVEALLGLGQLDQAAHKYSDLSRMDSAGAERLLQTLNRFASSNWFPESPRISTWLEIRRDSASGSSR